MEYRELRPSPPLDRYVRCYWTLRAPADASAPAQRVLPDGCVEVVINLGAPFERHDPDGRTERQPRMLLVGPTTRHMSIAATGDIRLVGIRFEPGGALPFLATTPTELRDAAPSLEDVALPLDRSFAEQLAAAPFGEERAIVDGALGERLSRARRAGDVRVLACVSAALAAREAMRVDSLVDLTGLGARQLERRFRETVGFGPKTLCRLVRFQRIVRAVGAAPDAHWARLAAGSGYADQSHMAREFREFAGTTLSNYVRELHPLSDRFHSVPGIDGPTA
jgi:AraC-like DNA-binding protein